MSVRGMGQVTSADVFDEPGAGIFGATHTLALAGRTSVTLGGILATDTVITVTGLVADAAFDLLVRQDGTGGHTLSLDDGDGAVALDINTDANSTTLVRCWSIDGNDVDVAIEGSGGLGAAGTYSRYSVKTADHTASADDHATNTAFNSASNCNVNFLADAGFPEGWTAQYSCWGSGGVTIIPESGVSIIPTGTRYIPEGATLFVERTSEGENNYRILVGPDDSVPKSEPAILTGSSYTFSGYLQLDEQASSPAAPSANRAALFARDNGSGKTQLCVLFPTGAVQVLSTEP